MRRKLLHIVSIISGLILTSSVFAAQGAGGLADIISTDYFVPSTSDKSIEILKSVFGEMGSILNGTPGLFNKLFEVFNSGILLLGLIVLAYTTIMSIVSTASRGEFLGRKMSMWVPLRSILGIVSVFPGTTGYSLIQIFMMWLVIKSVGLADSVWNTIVDYITTQNTVFTSSTALQNQYLDLSTNMTYSLICMQRAHLYLDVITQIPAYYAGPGLSYFFQPGVSQNPLSNVIQPTEAPIKSVSDNAISYSFNSSVFNSWNPSGASTSGYGGMFGAGSMFVNCGSLTIEKPSTGTENTTQFQMMELALDTALSYLNEFAYNYVKHDYDPSHGFLDDYKDVNPIKVISDVLSTNLAELGNKPTNIDQKIKDFFESTKTSGWIYAGAYYNELAALNGATDFQRYIKYAAPGRAGLDESSRFFYKTNADQNYISSYVDLALHPAVYSEEGSGSGSTLLDDSSTTGTIPVLKHFNMLFNFATYQIVQLFSKELLGTADITASSGGAFSDMQTNPLVRVQRFGYQLVSVIKMVWVTLLGILMVAATIAGMCSSLLPMLGAFEMLLKLIINPIMLLLGLLFVSALTMSVYVPLVPFIIFTFAALGWLLSVMETIIAAPLVAIGLCNPGGHEVFGRAEPAVNLMTNVFLRPTLMLFGLISGMILSYVMVDFLNGIYGQVITAVSGGFGNFLEGWDSGIGFVGKSSLTHMSQMGGIELVMFIVIYVSLVITILNKCFALIHVFPDTVLRWIGNTQNFGRYAGGEEAVKSAFRSGAGGIGKMAQEGQKAPDAISKGIGQAKGKE